MKQELVSEWMARDVVTVSPETSLKEAHDIMTEKEDPQVAGGSSRQGPRHCYAGGYSRCGTIAGIVVECVGDE